MKQFLLEDMGFDYVRVVTDKEVTKRTIDEIMTDDLPRLVGPNDRFVFYWSGHGDQRTNPATRRVQGFLPLHDSEREKYSSMISMDDINRWNSYLSARHALFILDACLSGLAGGNTKGGTLDASLAQWTQPARFLISAGTAKEDAIVADQWGGSLFTDALIETVRGHREAPDGVVSIFRVFDEVQRRVAIEKQRIGWGKPLTPQLRDLMGSDGAFFFMAGRGVARSSASMTAPRHDRPAVVAAKNTSLGE